MLQVGNMLNCGLRVTETETIKDGILCVTLNDSTERVWLSPERLEFEPDTVSVDEAGIADIADFDAILDWYDIEYKCYGLHDGKWRGEYFEKSLERDDWPEQCNLRVKFRDGRIEQWQAEVSCSGRIEKVTTSADVELTTLAALRATGIIEATLVSEYPIKEF